MTTSHTVTHPYDPLTAGEIERAVCAVRASHPQLRAMRFPLVRLDLPAKEAVRQNSSGPFARSAFLVVYDTGAEATFEARVSLQDGTVTSWKHLPGVQPAIMIEEILALEEIVKKDPAAVITTGPRSENRTAGTG